MANTPEELYEAIRPVLNGDKNVDAWKQLKKLLADPIARDQGFRQRYEPAILASLDHDWQDGVRVVTYEDPGHVRRYARIYSMIISYRHSGTIFKKTVKELVKDVNKGVPKGHYSGLYLYRVFGLPDLIVEGLLESGRFGPLEHFWADELNQMYTYARYNGPEDQIAAMVNYVLDRDAENLRSFGGSEWTGTSDSIWRTLIDRRDELTSLRSIYIKTDDLMPRLDALAPLQLEALNMTEYYTLEQLDALFEHDFSDHLARLKCHWHEGELDFIRWVKKGLAPSVEEWCVTQEYDYQHEALYFDMERATYWRERLAGKAQHLLDARVVELPSVDSETMRTHLFDGDTLKPSEELEALSVGALDDDDAALLIERALEAWPNLTALYLSNEFRYGTPGWDLLQESELLDELEFFDWGSIISFSYEPIGEQVNQAKRTVTRYREVVTPLVAEIMEGRWRPILAMRLARVIIHQTGKKPNIRALAALFGMEADMSQDTWRIKGALIEHIEALIAPEGMKPSPKIDESTWAKDWSRRGPYR